MKSMKFFIFIFLSLSILSASKPASAAKISKADIEVILDTGRDLQKSGYYAESVDYYRYVILYLYDYPEYTAQVYKNLAINYTMLKKSNEAIDIFDMYYDCFESLNTSEAIKFKGSLPAAYKESKCSDDPLKMIASVFQEEISELSQMKKSTADINEPEKEVKSNQPIKELKSKNFYLYFTKYSEKMPLNFGKVTAEQMPEDNYARITFNIEKSKKGLQFFFTRPIEDSEAFDPIKNCYYNPNAVTKDTTPILVKGKFGSNSNTKITASTDIGCTDKFTYLALPYLSPKAKNEFEITNISDTVIEGVFSIVMAPLNVFRADSEVDTFNDVYTLRKGKSFLELNGGFKIYLKKTKNTK